MKYDATGFGLEMASALQEQISTSTSCHLLLMRNEGEFCILAMTTLPTLGVQLHYYIGGKIIELSVCIIKCSVILNQRYKF